MQSVNGTEIKNIIKNCYKKNKIEILTTDTPLLDQSKPRKKVSAKSDDDIFEKEKFMVLSENGIRLNSILLPIRCSFWDLNVALGAPSISGIVENRMLATWKQHRLIAASNIDDERLLQEMHIVFQVDAEYSLTAKVRFLQIGMHKG